jgi:hypothetical protein
LIRAAGVSSVCLVCHYKKKSRISDKIPVPPICRKNQEVRGMEEGVVWIIPVTIIPLAFPRPFFNAKAQRCKDAKTVKNSLRLRDFALKGFFYPRNPRNPWCNSFGCGFTAL